MRSPDYTRRKRQQCRMTPPDEICPSSRIITATCPEAEPTEDVSTTEEIFGLVLATYAGEWVAVQDHKVVAHAKTLRELRLQPFSRADAEVFGVAQTSLVCPIGGS